MGKDPEWMMRRYTARQIFSMAEMDIIRLTASVRFVLAPLNKSLSSGKPSRSKVRSSSRSKRSENVIVNLDEDDSLEGVNAQIAHLGMKL